jgi:hypothetical protein
MTKLERRLAAEKAAVAREVEDAAREATNNVVEIASALKNCKSYKHVAFDHPSLIPVDDTRGWRQSSCRHRLTLNYSTVMRPSPKSCTSYCKGYFFSSMHLQCSLHISCLWFSCLPFVSANSQPGGWQGFTSKNQT